MSDFLWEHIATIIFVGFVITGAVGAILVPTDCGFGRPIGTTKTGSRPPTDPPPNE